ncbi:hypothetical protein FIBSPDRAFT_969748 [Athelia psychrophila]|uniref:Mre11 DNA-binding domain-containing protein n=1 Tax=Athelia psychrophila TaxID=1759441 RepID=A0A167T7S8_9AGAM|nr:hypothetical protein FIBSPDRAFT_969748 [Fibularhizoctonia sp. CBS 109695]
MNYIGKFDLPLTDADAQTTGIAIRPVLLRKGTTHLGLYGVGSVKDARMHFELRSNRTRTYMPKNKVVWFNVTHPPESINTLIDKANEQWDERNAKAVMDGEEALERMLPLIRLKVDTTGVSEMSNPIRFGQEFTGRIANPRDVRVFHRAKKASKSSKVIIDQPELNIDDPNLTLSEKPAKVRVATLVKEYLAAQELQLLGEAGMGDAILRSMKMRMNLPKQNAQIVLQFSRLKLVYGNEEGTDKGGEEKARGVQCKAAYAQFYSSGTRVN